MVTADPVLEHRYNDDLLAEQEDREYARTIFPDLLHVLDHPALRGEFERYNVMSNKAKRWVHRLGLFAIALAAIALLSSAATPILNGILEIRDLDPWVVAQVKTLKGVAVWFEIAGLIGAGIAIGGLWISKQKKQWLQCRLMTERLRVWHFQMLIHRGKDIEESCNTADPQAIQNFEEKRAKWFTVFKHEHEGKLDSILHNLIESPEASYIPLHDGLSPYSPARPVLDRVFEAYKALRLKHQAEYAAHRLQKSTDEPIWKPHKWPVNVLKSRLSTVTGTCILVALAVSAYIVFGHFAHWPAAENNALPALILCLLVLNVAARSVQDGLAVREESQRLSDYAHEVGYLLTKFETSNDRDVKLQLMQDMERAAIEEMKDFLRAHFEARFIL